MADQKNETKPQTGEAGSGVDIKKGGVNRARRERIPLGSPRMKLGLSAKAQEYFKGRQEVVRWVNDDAGNLHAASVEDSYRFVEESELYGDPSPIGQGNDVSARPGIDSRVSRTVGRKVDGSPLMAYLMAKPLADYEEDREAERRLVDSKEAAMRRGETEFVENSYVPSSGIKITTPRRPIS